MIDVKTLRIGSHVCVGGKHVRICGITKRKVGYHENGKPCGHLRYARLSDVEPILIASELLEKIGHRDNGTYILWHECDQIYHSSSYRLDFKKIGKSEYFKLKFRKKYGYGGTITCRYLHEAEAFLALHGVELIKE